METTANIVKRFVDVVVDPTILLIFSAGLFLFMWGLVVFVFKLGEGDSHTEGKSHMLWGLVGMLVMISVYGILSLINSTFGLQAGNPDMSRMNNVTAPYNFTGRQ